MGDVESVEPSHDVLLTLFPSRISPLRKPKRIVRPALTKSEGPAAFNTIACKNMFC